MKPATLLGTGLLAAVSLAHLLRLLFGFPVTVADKLIPMWLSALACVVSGAAAWMLWRSRR